MYPLGRLLSCVAQGCFSPWSIEAKFPWPCVQGPWARAWVWAAFGSMWVLSRKGFHVGASWTPRPSFGPWQGPRQERCKCDKHSLFGSWLVGRKDKRMWGQQVKVFVQAERRETVMGLQQ